MLFLFLLLLLPTIATSTMNVLDPARQQIADASRAKAEQQAKIIDQTNQNILNNRPEEEKLRVLGPDTNISNTYVNITNRSDKKASFALSAIHTTQEKTTMYSKKYSAYLTQTVITDPVEAEPLQTALVRVNKAGLDLAQTEKIFGIVVFAAQVESVTQQVRKDLSSPLDPAKGPKAPQYHTKAFDGSVQVQQKNPDGKLVTVYFDKNELDNYTKALQSSSTLNTMALYRVYEYEITFTENIDTFMSNPKAKSITLKTAQNYLDFPQDFVFNAKTERQYTTPNAARIIEQMKAVENKYNNSIFPPQYFNKEFVQQLPEKEITNLTSYIDKLLREPVPMKQALLGTLLDCGKYNGIAAALVKIAIALVMAITGGAAAIPNLLMDAVDNGMNFANEIKDARARS